jgi:hypothetical protein
MILLQQGQLNRIAVTLSELKNDLLPNNWLFVFYYEQSQGDEQYSKRAQLPELSVSTDRYNYFELTEGVDITFDKTGDYEYFVYQMPNDTSTDELIGELVETGKMTLKGAQDVQYTYNVPSNTYING